MFNALTRSFQYHGRSNRTEFWSFILLSVLLEAAALAVDSALLGFYSGSVGVGYLVVTVCLIIPSISLVVRRLHDVNANSWWMIFFLIPILGLVLLIIVGLMPGTPTHNDHGPPMAAGVPTGAQTVATPDSPVSPFEEIERLHSLLQSGAITQAEFDQEKARLLRR